MVAVFHQGDGTFCDRISYHLIFNAFSFKNIFCLIAFYLNNDGRLLAECHADNVVAAECAEVDVHAAISVREVHLKQCGDESAG